MIMMELRVQLEDGSYSKGIITTAETTIVIQRFSNKIDIKDNMEFLKAR